VRKKRQKKEEGKIEITGKNIMSAYATQGGHKYIYIHICRWAITSVAVQSGRRSDVY